jgi:glycine/D-amino acid oxidase-like deaminating enzyme
LLQRDDNNNNKNDDEEEEDETYNDNGKPQKRHTVDIYIKDMGLKVWGTPSVASSWSSSSFSSEETRRVAVVVVGGGIVGSLSALRLKQQRPDWDVTLLDDTPESTMGRTTRASWAWLNGNNKRPRSYQWLNQLGLHAWKHHPVLRRMVSWRGSLVRFRPRDAPDFVVDGGYPYEGPLSTSRIRELEPYADWSLDGDDDDDDDCHREVRGLTYFFPDEGCVDPANVVATVREEARRLGVDIRCEHVVVRILTEDGTAGRVSGVEVRTGDNVVTTVPADLVVVAAGCGTTALAGIPLLDRPGRIEYGRRREVDRNNPGPTLTRILVDPERSSHVLQRNNGDIVAGGGGDLEFGGTRSTLQVGGNGGSSSTTTSSTSTSLLSMARRLAPSLLTDVEPVETHQAGRPMPEDGLPVVGYTYGGGGGGGGIYVVVAHSAMTLGPLLSALAVEEITTGTSLDLLENYRPSRFHPQQ